MDQLLEVKNLSTFFETEEGTVKAVNDVSFNINRGETIGIVGESGSGKSVTALSIMRLVQEPPGKIKHGEINYFSKGQNPVDLLKLTEDQIRKYRGNAIGMIFQEPMTSLNPVFRCGNQVLEAVELHMDLSKEQSKQRVIDLFAKVQLPDPERIYRSYPHELSGGQKQRVMIAMAMSCNPDLLIADEPTTALDVTVQKSIIELMDALKKETGTAVMFITHDLGVISEIADRVIVMYKGKIVEQGPLKAIFENPQHPYTKSLLACRPPLDYRLRKLPIVSDFMAISKDENGELLLTEKDQNAQELIDKFKITEKETTERYEKLIHQEPLLKVDSLKTWFPATKNFFGKPLTYVKAVDDISFEVYPGETLGLVGESGCGKTTLGRTILRLTQAQSGKVWYKGQNLLTLSDKEMRALRKEIQIIFQDPYSSLNPRITIGNAIKEPMTVHGILNSDQERKAKVNDLLNTVGLSDSHYDRYPHEFSGGQRQRVCIARALALNPSFIICDESVSALDVSVQAQVLNLLIDLREKFNLTYIFISHDLSVVKFMSDRMIVMNKGKIEEMGKTDDIYNSPSKSYTQKLIDAIPK